MERVMMLMGGCVVKFFETTPTFGHVISNGHAHKLNFKVGVVYYVRFDGVS